MSQAVELPIRCQNRRHTLEWKRTVVEQTFEPGAAVARVAPAGATLVLLRFAPEVSTTASNVLVTTTF